MTLNGWLQIALYCAIVTALVKPLGGYMTRVFAGEPTLLSPALGPVERFFTIVFPLLSPTFFFLLVIIVVGAAVLALDAVIRALDGKSPKKVIVVPQRIVNVVA